MPRQQQPPLQRVISFLFLVALTTQVSLAASISPASVNSVAVLLKDTIWVYGGGRQGSNTFTSLEVSSAWSVNSPPWNNKTKDVADISPLSVNSAIFLTVDNTSLYFYEEDLTEDSIKSAQQKLWKYDTIQTNWKIISSTDSNVRPLIHTPVIWDIFGTAWIWGGYNSENEFVSGSNNSIFIIGGMTMQDESNDPASMADILVFDTLLCTWKTYEATGKIPRGRSGHTALLGNLFQDFLPRRCRAIGPDGRSIIMYGGAFSETVFGDVHVLDTQNFTWIIKNTTGSQLARVAHTAVLVGLATQNKFGGDTYCNDTIVLDIDRWVWLERFTPPSSSSTTTSAIASATVTGSSTSLTPVAPLCGTTCLVVGALICIGLGMLVVPIVTSVLLFIRHHRLRWCRRPRSGGRMVACLPFMKDPRDLPRLNNEYTATTTVRTNEESNTDTILQIPGDVVSFKPDERMVKPDDMPWLSKPHRTSASTIGFPNDNIVKRKTY
ncbi:hypothetical protein BC936DRAFT_139427 [Jimgerdemannia flammicorona]|uniref:Kelch repeat protein n=1 Tax=Jimgerdemannia flammicorona TaxID=994334 RepID=A0A433DHT5_9FUNG|nr:hypothetical protein BC936DRAFT_139427 [Jimgerdemannia flammicorona]